MAFTPLLTVDDIADQEGATHLLPFINAVHSQESNGGANSRTSTDGARGRMQVMPATFKAFAQPGELIDDPDDNLRVGIRYIKHLGDKFGNDPAKMGTGYISGEGNVNTGEGSAWKNDHKDGNGKSVSSYVSDILGRLSPVSAAHAAEPARGGFTPISGYEPPARSGFAPIDSSAPKSGFTPLHDENALSIKNNPLIAVGEAGLNLASQIVSVPASGLAGLATAAGNAIGVTNKNPADTVAEVGERFTYEPRTAMGRTATEIVQYPFEKLAEGGNWAGRKVQDVTDSPVLATAADTAVNALPMLIAPGVKAAKGLRARGEPVETARPPVEMERGRFTPIEEADSLSPETSHVQAPSNRVSPEATGGTEAQGHFVHAEETGIGSGASENGWHGGEIPNDANKIRDRAQAEQTAQAFQETLAGSPDTLPREQLQRQQPPTLDQMLQDAIGPNRYGAVDHPTTRLADSVVAGLADQHGIPHEWLLPEKTSAQNMLGNDHRGHATLQGLDIAVENPRGSERSGKRPDGSTWTHKMSDHYGHVKRTIGADGEQVDVYIGSNPDSQRVFVVDQLNQQTSRFDEHKAMLGFDNQESAIAAYKSNFDAGWKVGPVRDMSMDEFKAWLANGDTTKPASMTEAPHEGFTPLESAQQSAQQDMPAQGTVRMAASDVAGDMPAGGKVHSFSPGANYTGFIDDTPRTGGTMPAPDTLQAPKSAARSEPLRREDILIDFAKALNTGIYEGRVTGKGVMGFFRPAREEVRIKRHADLETAAHEMAHLMDSRIPEIRRSWQGKEGGDFKIRLEELKALSYDHKKVYEGFAEFVRHYMTQPDVAQAKAPHFYEWFEGFMAKHPYGKAIGNARKGMLDWFNQDALDRARSKIGDHRPMNDALNNRWDSFRQATVDDLSGVRRMERDLSGKIAPNGAYESARLSRASTSIADGALRYGAPVKNADGSFSWKGKGLEEILKPVSKDLDNALLYFVGRSARELLAQNREHLFTRGEIKAMVDLRRPEFDTAFKEYQAWNEAVLDFAEAQGVINPAARRMWQRLEYMPFHRIGQPGGFKGKPGDWTGVKALTGGTENLRDILGNMTSNAAMLIDKAVKNEARTKIAELSEQQKGGKFMVKIPAESRPVKVEREAVITAILKSMGIDRTTNHAPEVLRTEERLRKLFADTPAMLDLLQTNMPPAGGNVVAVLKEGKPVWYEVNDPILLRSLEAIDRQPPPWIVKWLGLPKRVGQATITLTPDFMLANIARDTIAGSVMSQHGFIPIMDSLRGMSMRLRNDPLYKDFIANGGGMSSIYLDETKFRAKLEKFYSSQGIDLRTVLDTPEKLLGFVETAADAFEMSTRLGEYRKGIEAGEHPRHAAYTAREVSTDFAMRGDSKALGFMYDTVMFLKPAVLSWDRLYRGMAHDQNKGAIATKAGMIALMSSALYLLNRDNPLYEQLPDWDKDANWHFFIGDQHFRSPKIWEIGSMASMAERATAAIIDADPQGMGKDFARILGNTFGVNLTPQIIAPIAEQLANRHFFSGTPIETEGMQNLQPFMRAKENTSETLKQLGMATRNLPESMQINPVRAEALLRGYFNTWATYGLMLTDKALMDRNAPTMRTDQLPVVRRFYQQEPAQHTKYEQMFYDMLGEARRVHGTIRELDKTGRSPIADEIERNPLARESHPLEAANKHLQVIKADMRAVRRDETLTPDQKRNKLDGLIAEYNAYLERVVKESKAATQPVNQ